MSIDAEQLKSYRQQLGMTQEELAAALSLHRKTIIRCEAGESRLKSIHQREINRLLAKHQK